VLEWRALPITTAATLAQGLSAHSRTARAVTGTSAPDEQTAMLAVIADRLGHIAWMLSEDGAYGRNHPPSILEAMTEKEWDEGFDDAEDFTAAWAAITGGEENGN
jgi:hypothetical protein